MLYYRQKILDHYHHPRCWGRFKNYDQKKCLDNPLCGDDLCVYLKFTAGKQKIKKLQFAGEGCAVCIAAASMLAEKAQKMTKAQIKKIKPADVLQLLKIELSPIRKKCALLGWEVLQGALAK